MDYDNDRSGGGRSFGRGGGGGGYQGTPTRDEKSGGYRLHVGGIGDNVTENEVRDAFSKAGAVKELWLSHNADSPRFGFIVFNEQSVAENAISSINGQDLRGSALRVTWASAREERSGGGLSGYGGKYGGGGYGGGGGGYEGGGGGYGGGGYGGGGGSYGGDRGGGGGGGGDRNCYRCGQPGHISRECTESGGGGGGGGGYGGVGGVYGGGRGGGGDYGGGAGVGCEYRGARDLDAVLQGRTLFAGGIGDNVTEDEVRDAFGKAGAVKELWLSQNADSPRFGFIVFDEQADAENAIFTINGQELGGSALHVAWAKIPEEGIYILTCKFPRQAAEKVGDILKSKMPEHSFRKVPGPRQTMTHMLLFFKSEKVANDVCDLLWSVQRCEPGMVKGAKP